MTTGSPHDLHHDLDPHGLLAGAAVDPVELIEADAAARRRRRRMRLGALTGAVLVLLALGAVLAQVVVGDTDPAAPAAPRAAVNAEAVGVLLLRPGHEPQRLAVAAPVVGVAARERGAHATYELPGVVRVDRALTDARVAVGARTATATARIGSVELLDGRVRIGNARLVAASSSTDGRASGGIEVSPETTLEVDGVARPLGINERIAIEGVGTVIVNEQAVVANAPKGDAQTGPRYRTVGALLHLRVTQEALGLPAGSELVVGRIDAGVREGKVRKVKHPGPGAITPPVAPSGIGATPSLQQGAPRPGEATLPRRPVAVRGSGPAASAAGLGDYLFPVLGSSNYTNDWGAPRASTGIPHQGTDIFAEEGTPIVAIADGVLDRVGWNSIGGYRFWLFDSAGNSFYHAHLSAFSPLAQDGARVRRGDVIGFVGHTGDAQYTPPHLHFEIHPGNGAATNPYPFLGAWKRGVAVAIGLVTGSKERVAPLALLGFTDIAANSGLQESVLDSVPDTRARSIDQETAPRPTDESLKGAIEGPGTVAAP